MAYPTAYHAALNHLIEHGHYVQSSEGRRKIAHALRLLRALMRRGTITRDQLERARYHFHYMGHPVRQGR
jgi:hypothetical protein